MNKEEFSSLLLQGNLLKAFGEVVTASLVTRLVLVSNLLSIYSKSCEEHYWCTAQELAIHYGRT